MSREPGQLRVLGAPQTVVMKTHQEHQLGMGVLRVGAAEGGRSWEQLLSSWYLGLDSAHSPTWNSPGLVCSTANSCVDQSLSL